MADLGRWLGEDYRVKTDEHIPTAESSDEEEQE
jgi:endogenous inhibitor of DNA gyrase (YacG/DUF329 family)